MDLSAPFSAPSASGAAPYENNNGGRGAGRGRGGRNEPKEVSLGMVIDRTSRVYIGNIPLDVIEADGNEALKPEFAKYGPVDRYVLFSDRTGRFTGAGMCTYRNPADARQACKELNNRENSDGTKLKVHIAQEHGVVLMRDLNKQRWEKQEARVRDGLASDAIEEDVTPGDDVGPRDRTKKGYNADGSWSHDMFDRIQRGENVRMRGGYRGPHDYNNTGRGRGGRGGRRGGHRMTMDERFEQYIQQRDGLMVPPVGGADPNAIMMMQQQQAPMMVVDVMPQSYGIVPSPMVVVPTHHAVEAMMPAPTMAMPATMIVNAPSGLDNGINGFSGDADLGGPAL